MRILALETTEKIGSVAAIGDDNLLTELSLDSMLRSAQSLVPAMHDLLERVGWLPQDVQLVAVSIGPGSFTGLRVGVTAAKVFAYCVGAEVMGVGTLEAIAAGASERPAAAGGEVSVVLDAQRGDVVVESFAFRPPQGVESLGAEELISADAWLARLAPGAAVTGPALERLADRLPPGVQALAPCDWRPRAAVVGRLAARYHAQGRRDDLWRLVPRYFRRSAAEEKWDAMGK
jgi:tRNA threonylcarbamoyladenosine biosynthesis protein TsaB